MTTDQNLRTLVDLARDGKKHRDRKAMWTKFWSRILVRILMVPVDGLFLMWGVGVAHAYWLHNMPIVGYWGACLVAVFVRSFLPYTSADKS